MLIGPFLQLTCAAMARAQTRDSVCVWRHRDCHRNRPFSRERTLGTTDTGAEMSNEPIRRRAAEHVAAFNRSVRSGDWAAFADRFTSDATMRFVGVPAGPFNGREAIAAGYASQPPSDTLTVSRTVSSGDVDELWFAWDNGGTGTMTLRWSAHLIAELTVTFA